MTEAHYEGIAMIGMAGRFPGAENVGEFWANLVAGKESVSFFSDTELAESGLDAAALRERGHYVAARGVLKDADCFDAAFFGINPKEAEVMDPQQRVFLEACWAALECAGYAPNRMAGAVGVFGGVTFNTYYLHVLHPRQDLLELTGPEQVMFGNERDYVASRVAYKLGLKGPAINVSTACSTSLVAVCQACQSLLTYQCDVALAGGASITVPQKRGYFHDAGNIGSEDGHTRTFDVRATGTSFSNGVGVVALKRLEDAVKDGDQIYAVIKGTALNNDGSQRVSFGAPGVDGQASVIAMAHALAGIDPATIRYVEAHGTATPLGDPIEVAGLTKAFRLSTNAKQFCALGSVKSNVGHLDVAAGVTGLIKTALALRNRAIPATLHFTAPNPKLDLENSPFVVAAKLQSWNRDGATPRRAGVSSFGMGGTNAHVVVEEAPELPVSGSSRPWQLLPLSAKTADALERASANLAAHLKKMEAVADAPSSARELADAAFTLQTGRAEFTHRQIVVCRDAADGAAALATRDPKRVYAHHPATANPPVVFMFPGQGAQYAGMGAEIYRSEPVFQAEVDRCAKLLDPLLRVDLRKVMFPAPGDEKKSEELLVQTRFTQPALFTIEYALAKLWMSWGITPAALIGHSVGEYVAGCLAGVFELEDALTLVARRGALVQAQPGGAMLAVRLPEKDLATRMNGQLSIAAINAPSLCVVSGPYEAVAELETQMGAEGVVTRHLNTSHAFHSAMMEPVLEPFLELLRKVKLSAPKIRYVSNVTARWITAPEAQDPEYWSGHVRDTVRFADGVTELMRDPRNVLLEVGPGHTLSQLARQHPGKSAEQVTFSSLPFSGEQEERGLLEALGRLWMAGVAVNWNAFYAGETRHRASLPTYPFERKRYWLDSAPTVSQASVAAPTRAPVVAAVAAPGQETHAPSLRMPPAEAAAPTLPRKERLLAAVRTLFQELSGYDLQGVEASVGLLEMGLDSLLLTQAAQLLQRKFGVALSFRQLMEDVNSIESVAAYLDEKMPAEAFAAAPAVSVAAPPPPSAGMPGGNPTIERLWQQQQQLAEQIKELMGQQPGAVDAPVASARRAAPAPATTTPAPQLRHGPFRPIDRAASQALSPKQERALRDLIARYAEKTKGSKKLASENRSLLADPRSVAGFNRLWKEMVYPISTTRSEGARVWDVDGNEYVDFVMGFGASLFGHRPKFVVDAVREQLEHGFEIGPIQPLAGEVAALMREFTGLPRFGFTNTGSEAVLAATRVARTVTGRDKIAVFSGSYHGIFDEVLVRARGASDGARAAAIAPGIPGTAVEQVLVLEYGSERALEILRARGAEIAAVIVEPVQSRRLDFQPREFLHELRRVTEQTGSALIFDEVVTGFRLHAGGAQAHFGVKADLATYGKVIGGGLPIGVVAGEAKFMDALDGGRWQYGDTSFPEVGVTFFAGTFVRHPLALAAAKAVLLHLKQQGPQLQQRMNQQTAQLAAEWRGIFDEFKSPFQLSQCGSLMYLTPPGDQKLAGLLFYLMRHRGIHIWENRLLVATTAHSSEDFARVKGALRESLAEMHAAEFVSSVASATAAAQATSATARAGAAASGDGTFPLTDSQKEIWLAAQMSSDAPVAYNESLKLDFRGAFDEQSFRAAVRQVVQRHPILLASISADGLSQTVNTDASFEPWAGFPLQDLSQHNSSKRESELAALIDRETSQPFDLTKGPLLRVRLVRLAADHHVALWTAHHIVCDGWSNGLVVSELARIYSALKQGRTPELDPPVPFCKYVETGLTESEKASEDLVYWCGQFAGLPPPLDLPADKPRPALRSGRASTVRHSFGAAMLPALKQLAGKQRTTMVVLLMTVFKTLLYRLTGQTDVVVGLPVAGQATTGNGCLVGHCVNLLPIRTRLNGDASFAENLAAVRNGVMGTFDHHRTTIGSILQHLKVPRSAGRPTLVEVIFTVDRDPGGTVKFDGLQFHCERNPKRALHYDLFFDFVEGPGGLALECDYNADLFDAATIQRWIAHYETLLAGVTANPGEALAQLPVLSQAEREEIAVRWNPPRTDVAHSQTTHEWFERQAAQRPTAIAVSCGDRELTYEELNRRANQLAHHLRANGVERETLIGLLVNRSLDMMVALLGIMKAGGAYVPLDPAFPADRLSYMVHDSGMRVLVTHADLEKELRNLPVRVIRLDADAEQISQAASGNPSPVASAKDLAYVLYTSGSTGKPKGVEVQHSALVNFLGSMQREPGLRDTDTLLAVTTLSFDIAGLELYLPLVTGARVVIASRDEALDPTLLMPLMQESGCTVMQATPATWRALLEAGWRGAAKLKALCGGEALPRELGCELLPRCAELWNMYGPTETTIWSTVQRVTSVDGTVSIGKPIANTQVYVLDGRRNLVARGVVGELFIGGAGMARGYLNRPELTSERFVASPFAENERLYRTGDLARWRADGTLECLGRVDTQVKIRGYRIELGEVEALLARHPAVRQCVAVAHDESTGSKLLAAYLEVQNGQPPSTSELRNFLRAELPEYMVPSVFVTVEKLPLTPNGKIDRKALPPLGEKIKEAAPDAGRPRDALEQSLVNIWREVLKVRNVGVRESFFDLGGHSLTAVMMLAEVRRLTGKTLPLATLFQSSTVEALAEILRQEGWKPSWSSLVPIRAQGSKNPLFLIHGAEGNVLLYRQLTQYLDADRPTYGLQSRGLDGTEQLSETIEQMAALYIKEILSVQPYGPYLLGGYCLGGMIALETARLLEASGHKVELVMMLDTYNQHLMSPATARLLAPVHALQNLWFHGVNALAAERGDGRRFLAEKWDITMGRMEIRAQALRNLFGGNGGAEHSYPHLRIKKLNDDAANRYVPEPYQGRVAVFRSKGSFTGLSSPSLGWADCLSDLEVHEVAAHPRGMLVEPFCRSLAETMNRCMDARAGALAGSSA